MPTAAINYPILQLYRHFSPASGKPNDIILVFSKLTVSVHPTVVVVTKILATLSTACLVTAYNVAPSPNFDSAISATYLAFTVASPTSFLPILYLTITSALG